MGDSLTENLRAIKQRIQEFSGKFGKSEFKAVGVGVDVIGELSQARDSENSRWPSETFSLPFVVFVQSLKSKEKSDNPEDRNTWVHIKWNFTWQKNNGRGND